MENELYKAISNYNTEISQLKAKVHKLQLDKQNEDSKRAIEEKHRKVKLELEELQSEVNNEKSKVKNLRKSIKSHLLSIKEKYTLLSKFEVTNNTFKNEIISLKTHHNDILEEKKKDHE